MLCVTCSVQPRKSAHINTFDCVCPGYVVLPIPSGIFRCMLILVLSGADSAAVGGWSTGGGRVWAGVCVRGWGGVEYHHPNNLPTPTPSVFSGQLTVREIADLGYNCNIWKFYDSGKNLTFLTLFASLMPGAVCLVPRHYMVDILIEWYVWISPASWTLHYDSVSYIILHLCSPFGVYPENCPRLLEQFRNSLRPPYT